MSTEEDDRFDGHTPGPWRITAIPAGNSPTIMVSGSSGFDMVDATGMDNAPNPVDVRLIAAAPRLLAERNALEAACDAWEMTQRLTIRKAVRDAVEAREKIVELALALREAVNALSNPNVQGATRQRIAASFDSILRREVA